MILTRIREIDIFSYYCSNFKEIGIKFCSPLRKDKRPSVTITMYNGKLLYKDYGHPDHSFDCFGFIMHLFGCKFYESLCIIDNDFGLNLSLHKMEKAFTRGYLGSISNKSVYSKPVVIIKKKSRQWMKKDAEFWSKYLISKRTLSIFGVCPITHYWINENRFSCDLSYAYKIGNKYKIYSPYEEVKWISNTTKKQVQGYDQLPKEGKVCIITSSLKDVMCLFEMGIPAIALQSEMQMPMQELIEEMQSRFKEVAIFYDNDFTNPNNPGQSMAQKICKEFKLKNIYLPEDYGVKDLSDYVSKFQSFGGLKTLIDLQLTSTL
jgi:hypothetical protein